MDRKKLIPIIGAAVVIIGIIVYLLVKRGEFLYAGTVEATEVDISSRLSAVIGSVNFNEGDDIKKDDLLVKLSIEDIDVQYQQALKDFKRMKELLAAGSGSQENYDRMRFKLEDMQVMEDWANIKSPLDGTVILKYHEPGEMVSPGTKLFTLADLSKVWAYVYVEQPVLSKLSIGMQVEGFIPEAAMKKFSGKIAHIKEEAEFTPRNVQTRKERTRLVYGVKVEFENKERFLKPGMTIEVKLPA